MSDITATGSDTYTASPIRRRATQDEMEVRAEFFIAYARDHAPVTVRQLYYQAEVHGIPGIEKDDAGYDKVQRQVLALRREGRLAYRWIADATRWMRKPASYAGVQQAIEDTATFYRKSLWSTAETYVEIWCEKDAVAGTIYPITAKYDVPLMVAKGFASETFCFEAVASRGDDCRPYYVYYMGDFDRSGVAAADSLRDKLRRFGAEQNIRIYFQTIGVTPVQIIRHDLPTREPKRKTTADKAWKFPYACELDALPPDIMRDIVERAINLHLPQHQLALLKEAEASERELLTMWAQNTGVQQ